jgi:5-methylcytosine-specific restriction protein A
VRRVRKRSCTKVAGCPAFDCKDDNCLGRKLSEHKPPSTVDDRRIIHNQHWYSGKRWASMRLSQLSLEPLCQRCLSYGIRTAGLHIDHIVPHRGNAEWFFEKGNLQTLCLSCHSVKTVAEQTGEILDYREFKSAS